MRRRESILLTASSLLHLVEDKHQANAFATYHLHKVCFDEKQCQQETGFLFAMVAQTMLQLSK